MTSHKQPLGYTGESGALPASQARAAPPSERSPQAVSGKAGIANAERAAIRLAYGLLWHMRIDTRDDNLKLASEARKALLAVMSKDDQFHGIDAAKMTDGRFTGAA